MSAKILLSVAFGGAFGAVMRYLMMSGVGHWLHAGFPYGTLLVNIIGSFALGSIIEISGLVWSPSQEMRAFLVVGLCGGFTTFSTFSLDVFVLIERGHMASAGLYITASVLLAVGGLYAGMHIFRQILT
ncbi:MAG: fluoride efflux transporter CrcB [Rhodospirillaceae bacterium]|jgi:fluoride exporter|nr:fluoride efflux transporter CrcB [Rhodospirillaceae bacterium]MBT4220649.1 fluoride efflux transporter CrcB [Rhodospirillaceae bacterium]MBT5012885.1 fluoride efflux transporter CrcB [Rhodospirillaceae bacterium]MBT7356207.1 fluoride efflux transporter CrcB [Rhodospirillaceae bacterium]